MNSPPSDELHVRLRHDLVGHGWVLIDPGQERGRQRGDQDRAGQRGAERRPELARRVLQAADLRALAVGDGRDRDRAELRGEAAHPETDQQQRPGHDLGAVASTSIAANSTTMPDDHRRRTPMSTTRRGETRREEPGHARGREQHRDRQRRDPDPVRSPRGPSATDRYSGITKNSPIITMNWKKNISSPPVICRLAKSAGFTSGSRPAASRRRTCCRNSQHRARSPPRIEPDDQRHPEQRRCTRRPAGSSPTPRSAARR